MKSNKCSNCGATVDIKTLTCPYCKSTYAQPTEKQTSSFSNTTLGSLLGDLGRALKPLDNAIKPLYDEIKGNKKRDSDD